MVKTKTNKTKIRSENLFPVVGVGVSVGGLAAFKELMHFFWQIFI
jgi:chemotaxis response regulator CheB